MRLGALGIKVAAHPRIVDVCLRRGLQLDVAVESAPAVHCAEKTLARRNLVARLRDHDCVRAWRNEVGDVVLVRAAVAIYQRHLPVVNPEPPL